jgi:hypothetical protein
MVGLALKLGGPLLDPGPHEALHELSLEEEKADQKMAPR